jgi:hypothetical protein
MDEAAAYLRYDRIVDGVTVVEVDSCVRHLKKHHPEVLRRYGRRLLIHVEDLEALPKRLQEGRR